ncbi:hypothetical protein HK101_002677, partial [Irineochytrium annulatum]
MEHEVTEVKMETTTFEVDRMTVAVVEVDIRQEEDAVMVAERTSLERTTFDKRRTDVDEEDTASAVDPPSGSDGSPGDATGTPRESVDSIDGLVGETAGLTTSASASEVTAPTSDAEDDVGGRRKQRRRSASADATTRPSAPPLQRPATTPGRHSDRAARVSPLEATQRPATTPGRHFDRTGRVSPPETAQERRHHEHHQQLHHHHPYQHPNQQPPRPPPRRDAEEQRQQRRSEEVAHQPKAEERAEDDETEVASSDPRSQPASPATARQQQEQQQQKHHHHQQQHYVAPPPPLPLVQLFNSTPLIEYSPSIYMSPVVPPVAVQYIPAMHTHGTGQLLSVPAVAALGSNCFEPDATVTPPPRAMPMATNQLAPWEPFLDYQLDLYFFDTPYVACSIKLLMHVVTRNTSRFQNYIDSLALFHCFFHRTDPNTGHPIDPHLLPPHLHIPSDLFNLALLQDHELAELAGTSARGMRHLRPLRSYHADKIHIFVRQFMNHYRIGLSAGLTLSGAFGFEMWRFALAVVLARGVWCPVNGGRCVGGSPNALGAFGGGGHGSPWEQGRNPDLLVGWAENSGEGVGFECLYVPEERCRRRKRGGPKGRVVLVPFMDFIPKRLEGLRGWADVGGSLPSLQGEVAGGVIEQRVYVHLSPKVTHWLVPEGGGEAFQLDSDAEDDDEDATESGQQQQPMKRQRVLTPPPGFTLKTRWPTFTLHGDTAIQARTPLIQSCGALSNALMLLCYGIYDPENRFATIDLPIDLIEDACVAHLIAVGPTTTSDAHPMHDRKAWKVSQPCLPHHGLPAARITGKRRVREEQRRMAEVGKGKGKCGFDAALYERARGVLLDMTIMPREGLCFRVGHDDLLADDALLTTIQVLLMTSDQLDEYERDPCLLPFDNLLNLSNTPETSSAFSSEYDGCLLDDDDEDEPLMDPEDYGDLDAMDEDGVSAIAGASAFDVSPPRQQQQQQSSTARAQRAEQRMLERQIERDRRRTIRLNERRRLRQQLLSYAATARRVHALGPVLAVLVSVLDRRLAMYPGT